VKLSAGIEGKSSVYASYGTTLHDVAAYCFKGNIDPAAILSHDSELEPVRFYLANIRAELKRSDQVFVEQRLDVLAQQVDPDLGGTLDFARFRPVSSELLTVDYKTGSGVNVEAEGNTQLLIYSLGVMLSARVKPKQVRLKIIQPRLPDPDKWVKEWTIPVSELLDFAGRLKQAARATREENPAIVPGPVQCMWCPAGEAGICDKRVKFRPRKVAAPQVAADDMPKPKAII